MNLFTLTDHNSIANQFLAELRHTDWQKDTARFRTNLERIGTLLAYEVSKTLAYQTAHIPTPLATKETQLSSQMVVLATILRAGLPMYQGFLQLFDTAESAFIGAYRGEYAQDDTFDIVQGYTVTPNLQNKVLILIDPMLATGKSIRSVYESLLFYGKPSAVHIACVLASRQGIEFVQHHIPQASIWAGDIDDELNAKSYIIPGLGDAGDLAFGRKK
ncbi:MAG: uracil phosphoribosyltransferase [Bacteroidetes bacterium]|nr:MAG: uracil phosphoribosyltransferase [Bacteroidota bacterium]